MDTIMIVSASEKGFSSIKSMLESLITADIIHVKLCSEARRTIMERDISLVIINSPLVDETGEALSKHITTKSSSQVILMVKNEFFYELQNVVEDYGVFCVSKPINKNMFWTALKFTQTASNRFKKISLQNDKLIQKLEDIKIVDRAKFILISYMNMSEEAAHRYLEKEAMDNRKTKREIAEGILKTYEN